MDFFNIFISTFLTFSFLTVQASAESRFMLNDAMIPTAIGECENGICEVVYDTPEKHPSPQPFPEAFPTGEEHHPIMICQDGSIAHDCSHIGPKTGGQSPPSPEAIILCDQGYISYDNKSCVPTEMLPCAISGACTFGPAGGTSVSEPALPAMLLTLLGLGLWLRRRK